MISSNILTNQKKSKFLLMITGEISYAEMTCTDTLYCKYFYVYGSDWKFLSGVEEGISATCTKSRNHNRIVLNLPIEATFSSTNPFKWPQVVLCLYGPDLFGNDVIRGYGSTHLPVVPGRTERKVAVFVPEASTTLHKIVGFFTGRRAEFVDPRIVSMSEGREVTRVSTQGMVTVNFNTILKDLKKFGYDVIPQTLAQASSFTMPVFTDEDEKPQKDVQHQEESITIEREASPQQETQLTDSEQIPQQEEPEENN